jgi:hypothetical protein
VLAATGYSSVATSRAERGVARNEECARLADATGQTTLRVLSRVFWGAALMTVGALDDAVRVTDDMVAIAERDGSPFLRWLAAATSIRALVIAGDLDRAAARNDEALALGNAYGQPDAPQWWAAVAAGLGWLRGDSRDFAPAAAGVAEQYPRAAVWRGAQAWMLAEAGEVDGARAVIEAHGDALGDGLDEPWLFTIAFMLGQVAWLTGDAELGGRIASAAAPFRDYWAHYYRVLLGPNTELLGLCLAATGAYDEAVSLLEEARDACIAQRMLAHVPGVRMLLASVLLRRDGEGDAARAREMLLTAREEATACGARGLVVRVDALLA